jgi:transposase
MWRPPAATTGISRPCFYKWLRLYEELGEAGLRDGSSAPLNTPKATKPEVVSKIIYLRQHYHFGPQKIAMYLDRYHDISISPSGVWRILNKLGMSRLPSWRTN